MKPTVRFLRHDGICRPMNVLLNHPGRSTAPRPGSTQASCKGAPEVLRPTHRRDEYRPVIPQRVARQHCPPPLHRQAHPKTVPGSATINFQRTVNSVLTVCLSPGDNPSSLTQEPLQTEPPQQRIPAQRSQSESSAQRFAVNGPATGPSTDSRRLKLASVPPQVSEILNRPTA